MLRCRAWVIVATRGRHLSRNALRAVAVLGDDGCLPGIAPCRSPWIVGSATIERAAHVGDRVAQPRELQVFARDDVLVGVVEVVVADDAGGRDVALAHGQLVAIELAQQVEQFGGLHALCFSLQVMQTRVQGIAFSRAGAIGSPQSRQIP